jgi:hypothetical protein
MAFDAHYRSFLNSATQSLASRALPALEGERVSAFVRLSSDRITTINANGCSGNEV